MTCSKGLQAGIEPRPLLRTQPVLDELSGHTIFWTYQYMYITTINFGDLDRGRCVRMQVLFTTPQSPFSLLFW